MMLFPSGKYIKMDGSTWNKVEGYVFRLYKKKTKTSTETMERVEFYASVLERVNERFHLCRVRAVSNTKNRV